MALHVGTMPAAADEPTDADTPLQKMFQISELKFIVFHHMSLYDLLLATQVCKEWQDLIVHSTTLRNRLLKETLLLYETLPFQYAARIGQSEPAFGMATRLSSPPQDRAYFLRVPPLALANGKWIDGTLIIFRCHDLHIKLPIWKDPEFQLPKNAKAHLFEDEALYWGPFHRSVRCWRLHLPRLPLCQTVRGQSLEQKDYFSKHFTNMLQKYVCTGEECLRETHLANEVTTQVVAYLQSWRNWAFMGYL